MYDCTRAGLAPLKAKLLRAPALERAGALDDAALCQIGNLLLAKTQGRIDRVIILA
jgi:hypothetical protein